MSMILEFGNAGGQSIVLPISGGTLTIDWGDGTIDNSLSHIFGSGSTFTVTIGGSFTTFGMGSSWTGASYLSRVISWGSSPITSFVGAFFGCTSLVSVPTIPTGVTNMSYMFSGATAFNQDLSGWNVSTVTNMSYMFTDASAFNQDLYAWKSKLNSTVLTPANHLFFFRNAVGIDITTTSPRSPFLADFILTFVVGVDREVRLPISTLITPLTIRWGNNVTTTAPLGFIDGSIPGLYHFYGSAGTYVVSITGQFTGFGPPGFLGAALLKSVDRWETIGLTNLTSAFNGCPSLTSVPTTLPLGITNMSRMFSDATVFNQDLSGWNVSSVTDMSYMFNRATAFNGNITSWNVSNVTTMFDMFNGATAFNRNINSWNVSKVTNMSTMFSKATVFNQNINSWNVSAVTNMSGMFTDASAFNGNITSWNVSNVTSMNNMFTRAIAFNQNISRWNVSKVTNMSYMFNGATAFNQDLYVWKSKLTSDVLVFGNNIFFLSAAGKDITRSSTRSPFLAEFILTVSGQGMCALPIDGISTSVTITWGDNATTTATPIDRAGLAHNYDPGGTFIIAITGRFTAFGSGERPNSNYLTMMRSVNRWETIGLTNFTDAFNGCTLLTSVPTILPTTITNVTRMFQGANAFTQDLSVWKPYISSTLRNTPSNYQFFLTSGGSDITTTSMRSPLYSGVPSVPRDLSGYAIRSKSVLLTWNAATAIGDISAWYNVTGSYGLSRTVYGLTTTFTGLTDGSAYTFNVNARNTYGTSPTTSVIITPNSVFSLKFNVDAGSTITLPINDISGPLTITWGDGNTTTLIPPDTYGLSNTYIDTGSFTVTVDGSFGSFGNISGWEGNTLLQEVTSWNTPGLTSLSGAFAGCSSLTTVPNIISPNVTNTSGMFKDASTFNGDISKWNVGNVTNMSSMFRDASNFNQNLSNWDVANVTDMSDIFRGATAFNGDISTWNVGNVTNMSSMFRDASNFNQNLSNWDVANVTDMSDIFRDATTFNGDITPWAVGNVTSMSNMFRDATNFNGDISGWNVGNVTDMSDMFAGASSFNQIISSWNIANVLLGVPPRVVRDLSGSIVTSRTIRLLWTAPTVLGDISAWYDISGSYGLSRTVYGLTATFTGLTDGSAYTFYVNARNKYGTGPAASVVVTPNAVFILKFNVVANSFITLPINDISGTLSISWGNGNTTNITQANKSGLTRNYTSSGSVTVTVFGNFASFGDISGWAGNTLLREVVSWNTPGLTSLSGAFSGCSSLTSVPSSVSPNVTNMNSMFKGASNFNGDITLWDVTNVTNVSDMFKDATNFNRDISKWNLVNVSVGDLPSVIRNLSSSVIAANTVRLTWNAPALINDISASYDISGSYGISRTVYDLSATFTGLTVGSAYTFYVNARNRFGSSSQVVTTVRVVIPPSVPLNLSASVTAAKTVLLTWAAPATVGDISAWYDISGSYGVLQTVYGLSATFTGLTDGSAYTFYIKARNTAETGPPVSTTILVVYPPSVPLSLSGSVIGPQTVRLTWSSPTTIGDISAWYDISGSYGVSQSVYGLSATFTGLTDGSSYIFYVNARNTAGSGPSVSTTVLVVYPPSVPLNLSGTVTASKTVLLTWTAPATINDISAWYDISGSYGLSQTVYGLSATFTGLTDGSAYTFYVNARNRGGSGVSASTTVRVVFPPSEPVGLSASVTAAKTVQLTWSAPATINDISAWYDISGSYGVSQTVYGLSATFTGLTDGSAYTFYVKARNTAGTGPPVSTTILVVYPPSVPLGLSGSVIGPQTVRLTWSAPLAIGDISAWYDISGSYGVSQSVYGLSATFTGLTDGSAYTFYVNARNTAGSGSSVSTTVRLVIPPSVPLDLSASVTAAKTVLLTWAEPNMIYDISAWYDISGSYGVSQTVYGLSATFTGLTDGSSYTFYVKARNTAGSGPSVSTTVLVVYPPSVPLGLSGSAIGPETVRLTWSSPTTIGDISAWYDISGSYGLSQSVYGLSATFTGLTDGSSYTFYVNARNTAGASASVSTTVLVVYPPSVPLSLSATVTAAKTVLLTWSAPTVIGDISASYDISGSYGISRTVYDLSAIFTGLTDGSSYTFYVKARNTFGSSPSVSTTVRVVYPPSVPLNLSASIIASQTVRLSWSAPSMINDISAWYDISGSYGLTRTVYDLSATFTGLTEGSGYTFYVTSRNTAGSSPAVLVTITIPYSSANYGNSHTFTVPAGFTNLYYSLLGAGGGGGSSDYSSNFGGGGGSGAYAYGNMPVSTGDSITLTYGQNGGSGGNGYQVARPGSNGMTTTIINVTKNITRYAGGGFGGASGTGGGLGGSGGTYDSVSSGINGVSGLSFNVNNYSNNGYGTGGSGGGSGGGGGGGSKLLLGIDQYGDGGKGQNAGYDGLHCPVAVIDGSFVMYNGGNGGKGAWYVTFNNNIFPPSVPRNLYASIIASNSIRLTWSAPLAIGDISAWYDISGSYGLSQSVYGLSATFTGLTDGSSYTFYVNARNRAGTSPSAVVTLTSTVQPTNRMILEFITTGTQNIVLPISGNTNALTIDWGDGTTDNSLSHTFSAGTFIVTISGSFTAFGNGGSWTGSPYLYNVIQWGPSLITSFAGAFYGCRTLVSVPTIPTGVTNMSNMFNGATIFNQDLSVWDVSAATNMSGMFTDASAFNGNISAWNVSKVTNMSYMFSGATAFNQDLYVWKSKLTSTVLDVNNNLFFFRNAAGIDTTTTSTRSPFLADFILTFVVGVNREVLLPIGKLITPLTVRWGNNVTTTAPLGFNDGSIPGLYHNYSSPGTYIVSITGRFEDFGPPGFTGTALLKSVDRWETIGLKSFFNAFRACTMLTSVPTTLPPGVTNISSMFYDATVFNQDLSGWNVSNVTNMESTFNGATTFNGNISNWNVSNVTNMSNMFYRASAFNQNINSWNVSKVTNMSTMFNGATIFNQGLSVWDVSAVTNMSSMFTDASAFNGNISSWNVSKVTNMSYMFSGAIAFNQDLYVWKSKLTSAVLNVSSYVFFLRDATGIDITNTSPRSPFLADFILTFVISGTGTLIKLPLSNLLTPLNISWGNNTRTTVPQGNTGEISCGYGAIGTFIVGITGSFTTFGPGIFGGESLRSVNRWETASLTNFGFAFIGCITLTNVPTTLPPGVTNISSMFQGATVFNQDLSGWNVSSVTNMSSMFTDAIAFNGNISNWNVSKVTNMSNMFFNARAFNRNINSWNVSKVTNMSTMFNGATIFNQGLSVWDVSAVTNMSSMFTDASAFNGNISSWNVSKVTNMSYMFSGAIAFNQDLYVWKSKLTSDVLVGNNNLFFFRNAAGIDTTTTSTRSPFLADFILTFVIGVNREVRLPIGKLITPLTIRWGNNVTTTAQLGEADGSIPGLYHNYSSPGTYIVSITGRFEDFGPPGFTGTALLKSVDRWETIGLKSFFNAFNGCTLLTSVPTTFPTTITNVIQMFQGANAFTQDLSVWKPYINSTLLNTPSNYQFFLTSGGSDITTTSTRSPFYRGVPTVPRDLSGSAIRSKSVLLTWNAPTAIGDISAWYDVTGSYGISRTVYGLTTTFTGLTDGSAYTFNVNARNTYGTSPITSVIVAPNSVFSLKFNVVANSIITLPINDISGPLTITWGDGTTTTVIPPDTSGLTHTYTADGPVTVTVDGSFGSFGNISGWAGNTLLQEVTSWNTPGLTSLSGAFAGCSSLTTVPSTLPLSVTNTSGMFKDASTFNGDISKWNVGNVTNMSGMFKDATAFNGDISAWDVAKVTDMSDIFRGAPAFNGDISKWNVENVTNMSGMFKDATAFNGDISTWNVAKVTDMSGMFAGASSFNQNTSNWNVANVLLGIPPSVVRDLSGSAITSKTILLTWSAPTTIGDISAWYDVSGSYGLSRTVYGLTATFTGLTDGSSYIFYVNARNTYGTSPTTSVIVTPNSVFILKFNVVANSIITLPINDISGPLTITWGDGTTTTVIPPDRSGLTRTYNSAGSVTVTVAGSFGSFGDISGWAGNTLLKEVTSWNTPGLTSLSGAFSGCSSLTSVPSSVSPSVTDMNSMFKGASNFNGDISKWDVANVTNVSGMFKDATNFNGDISKWDLANVSVSDPPSVIRNLSASVIAAKTVRLTWSAPTVIGDISASYDISGSYGISRTVYDLSATFTELTDGSAYTFFVSARTRFGTSPQVVTTVRVIIPPSVPLDLSGTVTAAKTVLLTWTAPAMINDISAWYDISGSYGLTRTVYGLSATFTGLTDGSSYTFYVKARNTAGASASVSTTMLVVYPPSVPLGLSGSVIGPQTVELTWSAPSTIGDISASYDISGSYGLTRTVYGLSAIFTGLTDGSSYTFYVNARNTAGASASISTTVRVVYPPSIPLGLSGTVTAAKTVQLTWSAPATINDISAWYDISGSYGLSQTVYGLSTTFTGLTDGSSYTFYVKARNTGGSGPSASTTVRVVYPPSEPLGLSASVTAAKTVQLTWSASLAVGDISAWYDVSGSYGLTRTVYSLSTTFTGLTDGSSYTFYVKARNTVGTSPSVSTTVHVVYPPSVPQSLSGTVTAAKTVQLTWSAPSTIGDISASYDISGSYGISRTVYSLSSIFTGLTDGSSYTFYVNARNTAGSSPSVSTTVRVVYPPSVPLDLSGSVTAAKTVQLTWSAPTTVGDISAWYDISGSYGLSRTVYDLSTTFTGLTDGSSYTFYVKARNTVGTSPSVSTTVRVVYPPSVPQSLSGTVTAAKTVQLTWSAPTTIGDISASYDISGSYGISRTVYSLSSIFTGLTDGSSYTFYVNSRNTAGTSPSVSTTVLVVYPPSVPLDLSGSVTAAKTVQLTWSAPTTVGDISAWYDISGSYGVSQTVYGLSATFTGLTDGSSYTFYVNARNTAGSSPSVSTTVRVVYPPSEPLGLSASVTAPQTVRLIWSAPLAIGDISASYDISGSYGLSRTVYDLSATFTGLTDSSSYTFYVKARNTVGTSSAAIVTILVNYNIPPSIPRDVSGSLIGTNTFLLTWSQPTILGDVSAWYDISGSYGLIRTVYDLSATFSPLSYGTTYTFQIRSRNKNGVSDYISVTITLPAKNSMILQFSNAGNQTIDLPISNITGSLTINWGDGITDSNVSHMFGTGSLFTVDIVGSFTTFGSVSAWNGANYLSAVLSWGDSPITSFAHSFQGCSSLTSVPHTLPTSVTDLSYMFSDCTVFNQYLSSWNVSAVTNMSSMFRGATAFNQELSSWNLSTVTSIVGMFQDASAFNKDISTWNLIALVNADYTFSGALAFTQDLSQWRSVLPANVTRNLFLTDSGGADITTTSIRSPFYIGIPSVPRNLSGSVIAGKTVLLTWSAPRIIGDISAWYDISGSYGVFKTVYDLSATFTGLTDGSAYTFYVNARNTTGSGPSVSTTILVVYPPSEPVGLSSTVTAAKTVQLTWSAPTTVGDISAWYDISGSYGLSRTVYGLSATFTGLTDGSSYTFYVKARNTVGTSPSVITTVHVVYPPSVPQSLSGTVTAAKTVQLTWSAPTTIGDISASYDISGSYGVSQTVYGLSATFTGLTDGSAYTFYVNARNTAGSSPSISTTVLVVYPPTVPQGLSGSVTGPQTVQLTWTAPATVGDISAWYDISGSYGLSQTVYGLSATFTGLTDGSSYTFYVKARNTAGSSPSVSTTVVVVFPPSAPVGLSASVTAAKTVRLTWSAPAMINDISAWYDISGSYEVSQTVYGLSATFTGLTDGSSYTFYVNARNRGGLGPSVSTTILVIYPPSAPVGLSAAVTAPQTVQLTWSAPLAIGDISAWYDISGSYGLSQTVYGLSTTFTGLTDGSSYTFYVKARNTAGSGPSASTTVRIVYPPSVPLDLSGSVIAAKTVQLTWSAPATINDISAWYDISGSYGLSRTVYGLSATFTGLTDGSSYTFYVKARNTAGTSSPVSTTVLVVYPPSVPLNLSGVVLPGQAVRVTWSAPLDVGDISAWYDISGSYGLSRTVYTVSSTFTGLTDGSSYTFYVKARNTVGTSSPAVVTILVYNISPPSEPNTIVASVTAPQTIQLRWSLPTIIGDTSVWYDIIEPSGLSRTVYDLSATFSGLTEGSSYTFQIRSRNTYGNSTYISFPQIILSPLVLTFTNVTTVALPITNAISVDWGDGIFSTSTTRTYSSAFSGSIKVYGTITSFNYNSGTPSGRAQLSAVTSWGAAYNTLTSISFFKCSALTTIPNTLPPNVTTLEGCFQDCTIFNGNIASWDVSNVTNMSSLFSSASQFNSDISVWNVSLVTNMNAMFRSATAFNRDIRGWNVSRVTVLDGMFDSATAFTYYLGIWRPLFITSPSRLNMFTASGSDTTLTDIRSPFYQGAPSVPKNVTGTGGNTIATLQWSLPEVIGDISAWYTISSSSGLSRIVYDLTTTFTGLTNGSEYIFTIAGKNTYGTGSSVSVTIRVGVPPSAPIDLALVVENNVATLTWGPPAILGDISAWYIVSNGSSTITVYGLTTSFSDIITNRRYIFSVTSVNFIGVGDSATVSINIGTIIPVVTGLPPQAWPVSRSSSSVLSPGAYASLAADATIYFAQGTNTQFKDSATYLRYIKAQLIAASIPTVTTVQQSNINAVLQQSFIPPE